MSNYPYWPPPLMGPDGAPLPPHAFSMHHQQLYLHHLQQQHNLHQAQMHQFPQGPQIPQHGTAMGQFGSPFYFGHVPTPQHVPQTHPAMGLFNSMMGGPPPPPARQQNSLSNLIPGQQPQPLPSHPNLPSSSHARPPPPYAPQVQIVPAPTILGHSQSYTPLITPNPHHQPPTTASAFRPQAPPAPPPPPQPTAQPSSTPSAPRLLELFTSQATSMAEYLALSQGAVQNSGEPRRFQEQAQSILDQNSLPITSALTESLQRQPTAQPQNPLPTRPMATGIEAIGEATSISPSTDVGAPPYTEKPSANLSPLNARLSFSDILEEAMARVQESTPLFPDPTSSPNDSGPSTAPQLGSTQFTMGELTSLVVGTGPREETPTAAPNVPLIPALTPEQIALLQQITGLRHVTETTPKVSVNSAPTLLVTEVTSTEERLQPESSFFGCSPGGSFIVSTRDSADGSMAGTQTPPVQLGQSSTSNSSAEDIGFTPNESTGFMETSSEITVALDEREKEVQVATNEDRMTTVSKDEATDGSCPIINLGSPTTTESSSRNVELADVVTEMTITEIAISGTISSEDKDVREDPPISPQAQDSQLVSQSKGSIGCTMLPESISHDNTLDTEQVGITTEPPPVESEHTNVNENMIESLLSQLLHNLHATQEGSDPHRVVTDDGDDTSSLIEAHSPVSTIPYEQEAGEIILPDTTHSENMAVVAQDSVSSPGQASNDVSAPEILQSEHVPEETPILSRFSTPELDSSASTDEIEEDEAKPESVAATSANVIDPEKSETGPSVMAEKESSEEVMAAEPRGEDSSTTSTLLPSSDPNVVVRAMTADCNLEMSSPECTDNDDGDWTAKKKKTTPAKKGRGRPRGRAVASGARSKTDETQMRAEPSVSMKRGGRGKRKSSPMKPVSTKCPKLAYSCVEEHPSGSSIQDDGNANQAEEPEQNGSQLLRGRVRKVRAFQKKSQASKRFKFPGFDEEEPSTSCSNAQVGNKEGEAYQGILLFTDGHLYKEIRVFGTVVKCFRDDCRAEGTVSSAKGVATMNLSVQHNHEAVRAVNGEFLARKLREQQGEAFSAEKEFIDDVINRSESTPVRLPVGGKDLTE